MSESRVMNTSIRIASDRRSEHYAVQAAEMLFDGFMKVYLEGRDDEEPEEGEMVLPELHVGDRMQEKGVSAQCKYTVPPQRYSEATLVKKLEELEIGRPSTYATIISTLTTGRGYVTKGDKDGVKMPVTDLHPDRDRGRGARQAPSPGNRHHRLGLPRQELRRNHGLRLYGQRGEGLRRDRRREKGVERDHRILL